MQPSLIKNLKELVGHYRWRVALSVLLMAFSNALLIVNPLLLRQAVTAISEGGASIYKWGALLIGVALLSAILKFQMRIGFFYVSREAEKTMRSQIFDCIQAQSMHFFDKHGTGELLSRLTNDITAYRNVLGPGLLYPLFFITIMVPALIALFYISVPLALMSLLPMLFLPLFNASLRGRVQNLSLGVQRQLAELSNIAQEHFAGIRALRSFLAESGAFQIFSHACRKLIRYNLSLITILGSAFPFFTFIGRMVTILLVWMAAALLLLGWGHLTAADFVAFIWIQSYTLFPFLMLGWVLPMYARGSAAYQRLYQIYTEPIEVKDSKDFSLTVPPQADIEFRNLTFAYPETSKPALKNFTLSIPTGAFVGLTGPVGSGKSTLLRLLNREYEISPGELFIAGKDIRDYPLKAIHTAFVTVEQAPFLFAKTIADNVRFDHPEASLAEIAAIAESADLHETVLTFPDQYETVVGERGMTLSGGQKQRVALARALLAQRSIILLDDVFAGLDTATEQKVFQSLEKMRSGRTIILISHRASILQKVDRVIYLEDGRIVEEGSPQQLMAVKGHFAALVDLQEGL